MVTSEFVRLVIPLEMALVKGDVSITIASVLYAVRSKHECDFIPAVPSHTWNDIWLNLKQLH